MKAALAKEPHIRIAVVESDPVRFVGFRAVFASEPGFDVISASMPDVGTNRTLIYCYWATALTRTCSISSPA